MSYKEGGWEDKYIISKSDGSPVDENAIYFVLRLDTDIHARRAALAYAASVQAENPLFAREIREKVFDLFEKNVKAKGGE